MSSMMTSLPDRQIACHSLHMNLHKICQNLIFSSKLGNLQVSYKDNILGIDNYTITEFIITSETAKHSFMNLTSECATSSISVAEYFMT